MGHQPTVQFTPEGGVAVFMLNMTGATLLKGRVVKADPTGTQRVQLVAVNDDMPFGVVYNDIPTGQSGLIVFTGIVDVWEDGTTGINVPPGYIIHVSATTPGTVVSSAVLPAVVQHNREVGHTIGSKGAAAGLVRCIIHFN